MRSFEVLFLQTVHLKRLGFKTLPYCGARRCLSCLRRPAGSSYKWRRISEHWLWIWRSFWCYKKALTMQTSLPDGVTDSVRFALFKSWWLFSRTFACCSQLMAVSADVLNTFKRGRLLKEILNYWLIIYSILNFAPWLFCCVYGNPSD